MYTAKGQLDINSMLKQYSPLVRRLAHQMIAKLPANVEIDDLIQVGMIGLTDALTRFDAEQGVQFETFATQRIRGAMLDELRGADWMSRGREWYRAIWIECAELMEHYGGWKWWKHSRPDFAQVVLEIVDIWHFGLSLRIDDGGPCACGATTSCRAGSSRATSSRCCGTVASRGSRRSG